MKHVLLILFIIGIAVTGIFLPYIPGDYDYFAGGISSILQFAAFASLLLVPVGLVWCIMDFLNRENNKVPRYPNYLRNIAFAIAVIIILAAALGSHASKNGFSSFIVLGLGVIILLKIRKAGKEASSRRYYATPYYLIFIPLAVVSIRIAFIEKVKNHSTDYVIKQSELLIKDIEAYKEKNGRYPVSIQSTIDDYKPSISSVRRFHYELSGDAYNLYFEQISEMPGTEEIVMYNKLGEQEMTVHNQDLLREEPQRIIRGYHHVVELPQGKWKVFYFD